ncbi:hypothetical protein HGRIS_004574 [Hohenbuehelia grisea]|uniref:Uncharacterized protein n=1 Tax=Hohenbuehelia grisea TaxID=104357 RepID=A0ABR3JCA1_9AGAR
MAEASTLRAAHPVASASNHPVVRPATDRLYPGRPMSISFDRSMQAPLCLKTPIRSPNSLYEANPSTQDIQKERFALERIAKVFSARSND